MSSFANTITVAVVDDHPLVRAGIRVLIEELDGFTVVAEAGTYEEAVSMLTEHQPQILVTDISLPDRSGLDLVAHVRGLGNIAKVIVFSMHSTPDFVMNALTSGASGYLVKDAPAAELELALRAVSRGALYLGSTVSRTFLQTLPSTPSNVPPRRNGGGENRIDVEKEKGTESLTRRQSQVLTMIAQGKGTKQIAFSLSLSAKTVETYRMQVMQRLGIRDVAGLTMYAVRNDLVSL
jgi:DNA-binding NarL/FixJ family response regulator